MDKRQVTLVGGGLVRIVEAGRDGTLENVATLRMSPGMEDSVAVHVALALTDLAGLANGEDGAETTTARRVDAKRAVASRQGSGGPRRALAPASNGHMPLGLPPAHQRPVTGRHLLASPESYRLVRGVRIGRIATAILQLLRSYPDGLNGREIFELLNINPRSSAAGILRKLGEDGLVRREGPVAGVNVRWFFAVEEASRFEPEPEHTSESDTDQEPELAI